MPSCGSLPAEPTLGHADCRARYTVDDVAAWPLDGHRYELLDGVLLVTPSPALPHQVVATRKDI